MGETAAVPEPTQPVTFEQLKGAFNVFKDDYKIVNHPNTPVNTPFNVPNQPDAHGRQYNLTLIPEEMTEKEYLSHLEAPEGIVLFIGCMDRDAALPAYQELQKQYSGKKIIYLTVAGGVVQKEQQRKDAMRTIITHASQHQDHIEAVIATDHDHTCGKVKAALAGAPLAQVIGIELPEVGNPAPPAEQAEMKSLIAGGITELGLRKLFPGKVLPGLVAINRQGNAHIDTNFQGVQPKTINQVVEQKIS